jgi:hypothetical protein
MTERCRSVSKVDGAPAHSSVWRLSRSGHVQSARWGRPYRHPHADDMSGARAQPTSRPAEPTRCAMSRPEHLQQTSSPYHLQRRADPAPSYGRGYSCCLRANAPTRLTKDRTTCWYQSSRRAASVSRLPKLSSGSEAQIRTRIGTTAGRADAGRRNERAVWGGSSAVAHARRRRDAAPLAGECWAATSAARPQQAGPLGLAP